MLQVQEDQRPAVLTGADLSAMPDIGPAELIQGKLKVMSPTGYPHGVIENNPILMVSVEILSRC